MLMLWDNLKVLTPLVTYVTFLVCVERKGKVRSRITTRVTHPKFLKRNVTTNLKGTETTTHVIAHLHPGWYLLNPKPICIMGKEVGTKELLDEGNDPRCNNNTSTQLEINSQNVCHARCLMIVVTIIYGMSTRKGTTILWQNNGN